MGSQAPLSHSLKWWALDWSDTNARCTCYSDGSLEFGWIVPVGLFNIAFSGSCTGVHAYAPPGYSLPPSPPCGNSGTARWISHQGPPPGSPLIQHMLYQPFPFSAGEITDRQMLLGSVGFLKFRLGNLGDRLLVPLWQGKNFCFRGTKSLHLSDGKWVALTYEHHMW